MSLYSKSIYCDGNLYYREYDQFKIVRINSLTRHSFLMTAFITDKIYIRGDTKDRDTEYLFSNKSYIKVKFYDCFLKGNIKRIFGGLKKYKHVKHISIDYSSMETSDFEELFDCLDGTSVTSLKLGEEKYFPEYLDHHHRIILPKNITKLELSNMGYIRHINFLSTNLDHFLLIDRKIEEKSLIRIIKEINKKKIMKFTINFKEIDYSVLFNNLGNLKYLIISGGKKLNDKNIINLLKKTNLKVFDISKDQIDSDYLLSILKETKLEIRLDSIEN